MTTNVNKIIIIGSGPAGCTAAIYAARANLQPIMLTGALEGGQLMITTEVENFPGFAKSVQGPWLMQQMLEQAKHMGTKIINNKVTKVDFHKSNNDYKPHTLYTENGQVFQAQSVIISTGAQAKWLGLESESYFQGYGVSSCATCDGFFFRNQTVMVVGGGNTAVEEALYLTHHAKKVYLLHRRDKLRAEAILQQRLLQHKKIEVIWNSKLLEILGQDSPKKVEAVRIMNLNNNLISKIDLDGVFIAIGHQPNTSIFKDSLDMDAEGYITTLPNSTLTNIAGVFAAGDVQDKIYRQAVTAAGTGCMAAIDAGSYLQSIE